jgi:hypothetical protein
MQIFGIRPHLLAILLIKGFIEAPFEQIGDMPHEDELQITKDKLSHKIS